MGIPYLYIAIAIILISGTLGGVIYILSNKSIKPIPVPTPSPTKKPIATCPSNCNSRGPCLNGACACTMPWYGKDCSIKCEDTDTGKCDSEGKLICKPGWYPEGSCSKKCDLTNCKTPGGTCQIDGTCKCSDNFTGDDCSICKTGFGGPNCNLSRETCNDRGIPNKPDGTCTCDDNNSNGSYCQFTRTVTCNDKGYPKNDGTCNCDTNVVGNNCQYDRAGYCNGHGTPVVINHPTELEKEMADIYNQPPPTGITYECTCDSGYADGENYGERCKYPALTKDTCVKSGGVKYIDNVGCLCKDGNLENYFPFCGGRDSCVQFCGQEYPDRNTNLSSMSAYASCIGTCPSA